jgi:hypothetical protein
MVQVTELDSAPEKLEARLSYLARDADKLVTYVAPPGGRDQRIGGDGETHPVVIHNGRLRADRFEFEREGFRFVGSPTGVADFYDETQVRRVYYPECEALIMRESGAKRVVVFDHTLRTASDEQRETKRSAMSSAASTTTTPSGRAAAGARRHGRGGRRTAARRFAIIQVWRPINHPVESHPLAICDAQSVNPANLVVNERRYQDRVGQTYAITHDPAERWYWFPHMRPDEALVFKVYESLKDGRARWTAHTAFVDPTSPPDARPRESIEIRTLAFF